eukprot:CCRYP_005005-RB/>CCRYP_005005-RB protein AED:0.09 eAED:0.09 QI:91/1/1/1/1/1/5/140/604
MRTIFPRAVLLTILRPSSSASAFSLSSSTAASSTSLLASPSLKSLSLSRIARGGSLTPSALSMTKERPFQTWSYDSPCETMDWNPDSKVSLLVGDEADADLVIVGVFAPAIDEDSSEEETEAEKELGPLVLAERAAELDEKLEGLLKELAAENGKEFRNGEEAGGVTPAARVVEGGKAKRYVLLGLGPLPKDPIDSVTAMKLGASVASSIHTHKSITKAAVILPSQLTDASTIQHFSTAFYTNLYSDNRYRTGKKVEVKAESVESVSISLPSSEDYTSAIQTGLYLARGVSMTKDIVNAPHNILNSVSLADTAMRLAVESEDGCITCEILGKDECEERGMGAYLGVARGAETEPKFIHLVYKPKGEVKKKVGIVGKGLLFDTGGYNIKTSMMELMKFDCGGAAAVIGAARAIGYMRPEGVEAHFIVAACSNMINSKALVPSDVLTASNGKTIEVLNTDAEGRLTLADALVYADKELGCESIIELSTLTGACMISLGKKICGVWTENDDLAKSIEEISKVTGDKSWRMPMAHEYKEQLKSKIADISNLGDRYGGAITAALFLQEFVSKKKPFAHLDIAGPVWDDKVGSTGFGAKLVSEWVRRQGE